MLSDVLVDKYGIEFENLHGYNSTSNYVYWLSMMISPMILIIASQFKPYRLSYFAPIYVISLSLYWIFFTDDYNDKSYFNLYLIGFTIVLLIIISSIATVLNKEYLEKKSENSRVELLERIFDLTVLKVKEKQKNV